jgi:FkbM family methyltransferase
VSEQRILSFPSEAEGEYYTNKGMMHRSCFNVEWIENPKIILDIGAYDFGDAARFKAKWPDCRVLSVEASEDNYNKYAEKAKSFGVEVFNLAIAEQIGTKQFYLSKHIGGVNAQGSLLKPTDTYRFNYGHIVSHEVTPINVPTWTVDFLCESNDITEVDFLHLDVEGAEHLVFLGMKKIRPKVIFAEFLFDGGWENQARFDDTLALLKSYGYRLVRELTFDRIFVHENIVVQ